nr:LuxR C-terminal-related transcriptional regulator [Mycobacterium sp.]
MTSTGHTVPPNRPWSNTIGSRCPSNAPAHNCCWAEFSAGNAKSRLPRLRSREARRVFERLGTPLWAARARAAMDRAAIIIIIDTRRHELTPSEQNVARLTASGMTSGEVAATLIISPKTVEFP